MGPVNPQRDIMRTFLKEFWLFGIKQASACLFGAYMLALILITAFVYPDQPLLSRFDFLFCAAVLFQVCLLALRLEEWREAGVILVFHAVATLLELFKTSDAIGSWHYPGAAVIRLGNVPLFAGFMYSAVGSYIARVWRIFDFRFDNYPPIWTSIVLVVLIYANFFTHHFVPDARVPLLLASLLLFGRTTVHFKMDRVHRRMPLVIGWFLVATFIWIAENIATWSRIWIYPDQNDGWKMVPLAKLVAWDLLMLLSFVLVSLIRLPIPTPVDMKRDEPIEHEAIPAGPAEK